MILLVEDNPRDAELAMLALERSRVANEVVLARDGAEALDILLGDSQRLPRYPRLVLLDLKLPKIDGIEVLERIRSDERTAMLPIVVLTSSDEESDMKACYERHANSYIRKSVDFTEFTAAVQQIGQYWLSLNIAPGAHRR
ncbi:MAG: response regulator [Thermomicrobiales bacterium]